MKYLMKKGCLNSLKGFKPNVESQGTTNVIFLMAFASLKHSGLDAILKSVQNFHWAVYNITTHNII